MFHSAVWTSSAFVPRTMAASAPFLPWASLLLTIVYSLRRSGTSRRCSCGVRCSRGTPATGRHARRWLRPSIPDTRSGAPCIGARTGDRLCSRTFQAKRLISGICPKHSFKKAANSTECRVPPATSSYVFPTLFPAVSSIHLRRLIRSVTFLSLSGKSRTLYSA